MPKIKIIECPRRKKMLEAGTVILNAEQVYDNLTRNLEANADKRKLQYDPRVKNEMWQQIKSTPDCPKVGVPFDWREGRNLPFRHSRDRVNNLLGYVSGNVLVVCHWWNKAKWIWPDHVNEYAIQQSAEHMAMQEQSEIVKAARREQPELPLNWQAIDCENGLC